VSFTASLSTRNSMAIIKVTGDLDASTVDLFREKVDDAVQHSPEQLVLDMRRLHYISSAGLRQLVYARQKMNDDVTITLVGANENVERTIRLVGLDQSVTFADEIPE
jgi:anti-anti-sigma factor